MSNAEGDCLPPICPTCSFPLPSPDADYCPRCESPLSRSSTFDPLKIILTEGEVFRRGATRPSGIVVVGMWLIFGPAGVVIAVLTLFAGPGVLLVSSPILLLYGAILYKVTSRYRVLKRETPDGDGEEDDDAATDV